MLIDRRGMLGGSAAALALAASPLRAKAKGAPGWYHNAIIVDGLSGIGDPYTGEDILRLSDRAWAEMRASGVTAVRDTTLPVGNLRDSWEQTQKWLDTYHNFLNANPDRLMLVEQAADILTCKQQGRIGVIFGTQDTAMVGPSLDRLAELKKRGVRCVQLTYNNANLSGDGSIEPRNAGLTKLGKDTIRRIEAEKLMLDLAHGGARTIDEAVAFATRPLAISHTGARALNDHPRNISDAAIRAVAAKGGVVGVYFMPYLAANSKPTGAMLVDHIEHIANITGEDHVSIGTDGGILPLVIDQKALDDAKKAFEERTAAGIAAPGEGPDVFTVVRDYNSLDKFERLASALQARGWSTGRIEKLYGQNLLRLYRDAWGG